MELLTWEALVTIAGATGATVLIVQLLKDMIPIKTDPLSYIVALVVMEVATFALGANDWRPYVLVIFNAVLVTFGANRVAQLLGQDGRG